MCKITIRYTIQEACFHAKSFQKIWKDNTADRVNGVHDHLKMSIPDSLNINQIQS